MSRVTLCGPSETAGNSAEDVSFRSWPAFAAEAVANPTVIPAAWCKKSRRLGPVAESTIKRPESMTTSSRAKGNQLAHEHRIPSDRIVRDELRLARLAGILEPQRRLLHRHHSVRCHAL